MASHFIRLFGLVIFSTFYLAASPANAASSEEIIDGFSEFIVDRANANAIAIFERRLKNDENFKCYFPNTYEKIDKINIEHLFASKNYWEHSLEKDLEALIFRSMLVEVQQGLKVIDRNEVIKALQYLDYEYQGQRFPIDRAMQEWPQPLKDQVNGFSLQLANSLNRIEGRVLYSNICELTSKNKDELKALIRPYLKSVDEFKGWVNHVSEYGKNLRLSAPGKQALFCKQQDIAPEDCAAAQYDEMAILDKLLKTNDLEQVKKAIAIARRIKQADTAFDEPDRRKAEVIDRIVVLLPSLKNKNFSDADIESARKRLTEAKDLIKARQNDVMVSVVATIKQKVDRADADAKRIISMLYGITEDRQSHTDRALVALELLEGSDFFSAASHERLSRSVMFFASISDAEDKDVVKNILQAYALPAVSFAEKRKLGEGFFITSYLGFAGADADTSNSANKALNSGLFAPVGLEYNYGRSSGNSWSVMFSPIDMAYPVNLKLKGIDENVDFDDIVAPSLTIAYGFEDYPVNIGIGYQRGRKLNDVSESEERILFFISFDMPLFRMY